MLEGDELAADAFREECGVVGVFSPPDEPASDAPARLAYFSLHALQHRGQEGAGIVLAQPDGRLRDMKGLGLVSEVFTDQELAATRAHAAVGHVRYSTAGEKNVRNVQPFTVTMRAGQVAIGHNGNLTNAPALKRELELRGTIFNTSSDTEVILHLMATSVCGGESTTRERLVDALTRVEGAYSLCVLTPSELIAVRDPRGFRPLVMGRHGASWVFASETSALDMIGAEFVREVEPGEMVVVNAQNCRDAPKSYAPLPRHQRRACIFEHIYFSRANSNVFGRSVYMSRYRFGELLAHIAPAEADYVVPVPDSGMPAALGYSAGSGIPFQVGIMRSHYVGRTFIQPTQDMRNAGVKLKLAPVRSLIEGKRLVVVDDSVVRGTTSKKIVRMLREAGAAQVHMRIACPPIIGSCYYGVDTPNREELISYRMSNEEVREYIDADSVAFLGLEELQRFLGDEADTFCYGCFSGKYPVAPVP